MRQRNYGFFFLECDGAGDGKLLYNTEQRKWHRESEFGFNSACDEYWLVFRSLKAAKHHVKRHSEIPKGTRFVIEGKSHSCVILYKK